MQTNKVTAKQETFEIIANHDAPVQTVRASQDGTWLLTGDTERHVRLWKNGEFAYLLDVGTKNAKATTIDRIRSVAFSNDGSQFYVTCGHNLLAFRTEDGRRQWKFTLPRFLGFLFASPLTVDTASDGRCAISNDNGTFGIRDSFGRKVRQWKHNAAPRWIRFAHGEKHLIGSDSFSIRLWDCETGETLRGYSSDERIYNLEASHTKPIFAVRTLHSIQIYSLERSEPICIIPSLRGLPLLAFSADGSQLAASGEHGVSIWPVSNLSGENEGVQGVRHIHVDDASVLSLTFSADGNSILVGCSDGSVRKYLLG
jgi:WD40 repeat protein